MDKQIQDVYIFLLGGKTAWKKEYAPIPIRDIISYLLNPAIKCSWVERYIKPYQVKTKNK